MYCCYTISGSMGLTTLLRCAYVMLVLQHTRPKSNFCWCMQQNLACAKTAATQHYNCACSMCITSESCSTAKCVHLWPEEALHCYSPLLQLRAVYVCRLARGMLARRLAKRLQAEQQQQQLALNRGVRWADPAVDCHIVTAIMCCNSYI